MTIIHNMETPKNSDQSPKSTKSTSGKDSVTMKRIDNALKRFKLDHIDPVARQLEIQSRRLDNQSDKLEENNTLIQEMIKVQHHQ